MHAPLHVFAGSLLDREARARRDAAWVDQRLQHPSSRFLALWQLRVLVHGGSTPALAWATGAVRESMDRAIGEVLLGTRDDVAHFAIDLSPLADPLAELGLAGEAEFGDARALALQLPAEEAAVVAQARSLVDWHARHRFCAACGEPTRPAQGGALRFCRDCKTEHFPRTDPVAIALVVRGERALLGRQSGWPPRMFSALAGFVEPGESLEEAVCREVLEESGVRVGRSSVRYHSSQPWPFPSSLMIGCIAEAETETIEVDTGELEEVRWFTRAELRRALDSPSPDGPVLLPPPLAIAHHLVRGWALGS